MLIIPMPSSGSESERRLQILSITIQIVQLSKNEKKYNNLSLKKDYPVYVVGEDSFLIRDNSGTPWWVDMLRCKIIE